MGKGHRLAIRKKFINWTWSRPVSDRMARVVRASELYAEMVRPGQTHLNLGPSPFDEEGEKAGRSDPSGTFR